MKDGLPISDCIERTAAEQREIGCPESEPSPGADCDLPDRTRCYYAIEASLTGRYTNQRWLVCNGRSWSMVFGRICGVLCESLGSPHVLDTADCSLRPALACRTTFSLDQTPVTAQEATGAVLGNIATECDLPVGNGVKFEVDFAGGCARSLSTAGPIEPAAEECVARALASERWACAELTLCSWWDPDIR